MNAVHRDHEMRVVVEIALQYNAELSRTDGAHNARLAKARRELERAIDHAHEALHPKPPTKIELEMARRNLARRAGEQ